MSVTTSIPVIGSMINNAEINTTGVVQYQGSGGLKEILASITSTVLFRGMYVIPYEANGDINYGAVSLLGGSDAKIAMLQGAGIYVFNNNGSVPGISANSGGSWVLWMPIAVDGEYSQVFGDGTSTSFDIVHNLNTLYPTVLIYSGVNVGLPYTLITAGFTVKVLTANSINILYGSVPISAGQIAVIKA